MDKHVCYSINRKGGYVTIYNNGCQYPLALWDELRGRLDMKHQEVADWLYEQYLMEHGEEK